MPFSKLVAPQWSPDGQQIAFTLSPPENLDLGRACAEGGDRLGARAHFRAARRIFQAARVTKRTAEVIDLAAALGIELGPDDC